MLKARKLGFESLEGRRVCAGIVTATIVGQELVVTGGAADNYVKIFKTEVSGQSFLNVQGLPFSGEYDSGGAPISDQTKFATRINAGGNGGTEDFLIPPSGLGLKINMNGGNDAVEISGTTFNSVKISGGLDDDFVSLANVIITPAAGQKDYIQTTQAVPTSATGLAEDGNDRINFNRVTYGGGGQLSVGTGGGDDTVNLTRLTSQGNTTALFFNLGNGNDFVNVQNFFGIATVNVVTGNGNDTMGISNSKFKRINVDLGAAKDELSISNVQVSTKTAFDGGTGTTDKQSQVGFNNTFGPDPINIGFEILII